MISGVERRASGGFRGSEEATGVVAQPVIAGFNTETAKGVDNSGVHVMF